MISKFVSTIEDNHQKPHLFLNHIYQRRRFFVSAVT
jgi:hypothetical protein